MKKIFGILLSVIGSIIAISGLILKITGQASASVIDEANGPTSIFIAGKIGGTSAVIGVLVGIILIILGVTCGHYVHKLGDRK